MHAVADDNDKSEDIWWDCHQLANITLEAEISDNGRREVAECVETVNHEEVADSVDPEKRVQQRLFVGLHVEGFVLLVRGKWPHASDSEDAFFLGEECGILWIVWHEDPDDDAEQHGRDTSENEKPLPSSEVRFAVQERDSSCEETAEGACNSDGRSKYAQPCRAFRWLVP